MTPLQGLELQGGSYGFETFTFPLKH